MTANEPHESETSLSSGYTPHEMVLVKGRIMILLKHFWTTNDSNESLGMIAEDWADALRDMPFAAIERACKDWIAHEKRKPTPADIRERAVDARNALLARRAITSPSGQPESIRRWKAMFRPVEYYPTVDDLRQSEENVRDESRRRDQDYPRTFEEKKIMADKYAAWVEFWPSRVREYPEAQDFYRAILVRASKITKIRHAIEEAETQNPSSMAPAIYGEFETKRVKGDFA